MISTLFAIGKKTSSKSKLKQKSIKTDVEPELQTFDTYKDVGLDEEGLISLQNKLKNAVKQKEEDFGLPHRAKQDPKVTEAALSLSKNDISVDDFRNLIFTKNQPKNWDFVPRPAGVQEIAASVTGTAKEGSGPGNKIPKITRGIINVNKTIEEGAFVSSRLDIPAYNTYDVWAVTIHKARNAKKDAGSVLGFGQTAMLTDVTFVAPAKGGFMIATSQINKTPIARMEGRWKNHTTEEAYTKAQELLTDKNWTQVGYNPFRVSYFYDRATMNPVIAADEVIQVGPFVIAKNVKTAKPTDKRFEVKTKEGNRFNFEEGGKVSTNEQMDRLGFEEGGILSELVASLRDTFSEQQRNWEGDHGDIPVQTHDRKEANQQDKTYDIAYGHKIKPNEWATGIIHGIQFKDVKTGKFIPLSEENKRIIQQQDVQQNVQVARNAGWDTKLEKRGLSWDTLDDTYKLPLEDLAYNVGGTNAGQSWTAIFDSIKDNNTSGFVGNLRRKDAGQNSIAMDNRAAKAAYSSGLILTLDEAKQYGLELADTTEVPTQ